MDDFQIENVDPHIYHSKVAKEDIDLLGHVNHATYLIYFERARWSFLEPYGLTVEYIRETRVGPAVLEAHIKYQRELQKGAKFQIHTWAGPHSSKIGQIYQKMLSETGEHQHAEIRLSFGLIDLTARKLIAMDDNWVRIFEPVEKL